MKRSHCRITITIVSAIFTLAVAGVGLAAPPANDNFANAAQLSGAAGSVAGFNFDGTKEVGEPEHAGVPGGPSVWYRWIAPADGQVAFGTGSQDGLDTILAVYSGSSLESSTALAANDDASPYGHESLVSLRVVAGTPYSVVVDGAGGAKGKFDLFWFRAPLNDNFADAQELTGRAGEAHLSNAGATPEPAEDDDSSVWFRWTAPVTGLVKFETRDTDLDTVLSVSTGSSLATQRRVAGNDDDPMFGCCLSWLRFTARAGETYMINIYTLGESGQIALRWSPLIMGSARRDVLSGTAGPEEIRGGGGNDVLRGGGGDDVIIGGAGNDALHGAGGHDELMDFAGADRLYGGLGDDTIGVRDRHAGDLAGGGPGRDACRTDRGDRRLNCE